MERSHSGLVRIFAKDVTSQGVRGFESLPLRQLGKCKFEEASERRGTRRSHRI